MKRADSLFEPGIQESQRANVGARRRIDDHCRIGIFLEYPNGAEQLIELPVRCLTRRLRVFPEETHGLAQQILHTPKDHDHFRRWITAQG